MNIIKFISEMVCVKIRVSEQQGGALSQAIFVASSIQMLSQYTQKLSFLQSQNKLRWPFIGRLRYFCT